MESPLFIESLKIVNGRFIRPEWHWQRMHQTRQAIFGDCRDSFSPPTIRLSKAQQPGVQKCRITYDRIIRKIEIEPYRPRTIHRLKLVDGTQLDYRFKYADRSGIQELLQQKGDCDDILICQNGRITDTSYSNVAFYDGHRYLTPSTCLLNGTKRQYLLREGIIGETEIRIQDIPRFQHLRLINALLDLEDEIQVEIQSIL